MPSIARSWVPFLAAQARQPYFSTLMQNLDEEYRNKTIYPPRENIFRVMETPVSSIRVVLIGQDPYHGPGQAQGYSFSVPGSMKIPPSLQNIYKELEMEYGMPVRRSGDLTDWAKQGVFLLNQSLTVEQGKPASHAKIGWTPFVDALLRFLNDLDQPIVFLLLGKKAQAEKKWLTNPDHLVLEAAHPSPFSADHGFFHSGIFIRANLWLKEHGQTPIAWTASNLEKENDDEHE